MQRTRCPASPSSIYIDAKSVQSGLPHEPLEALEPCAPKLLRPQHLQKLSISVLALKTSCKDCPLRERLQPTRREWLLCVGERLKHSVR